MIVITLLNDEKKIFDHPVTVLEVAQHISPNLAKSALAGKVNGRLVDTRFLIDQNSTVVIITQNNTESLDIIRHSCAHLLAQAVKILYPSAQIAVGPVIENGFFYDFAFERAFTVDDLEKIEKLMKTLAKKKQAIIRQEISRNEAMLLFNNLGEHYKTTLIQEIPEQEVISLYQQGDFTDLCRGPHVPHTGKLNAFKLTKISGAYWQGNANNPMLSRIYGTAWHTQEDLEAYLHQLQEAEKRDHRKIAKNLDLFHIQDDAPGMIFWHPNGWITYQIVEQDMRKTLQENGYFEVRTPQIVNIDLWKKSGHCDKFGDDMFTLMTEHAHYAIKPMNCPCHVQIFKQGIKSYRELPLRYSEFGSCHRNEASGALHGLMRTRNFTQDDAHIFCTENQIASEIHQFIDLLFTVYTKFGFEQNISVKLSTRPEKRVGSDQIWDKAEKALSDVLNEKQIDWVKLPGEGAFYGPKIEFVLKDCIGRSWTTGTVQLDFSMPARLGAEYISETGTRETPVMLHRAIFGSLERFIAILLEHHAGHLPLWLAPVQIVIMNITDKQCEYAKNIENLLKKNGLRVKSDMRNEKIGLKIRENTLKRIPYQLILGEQERNTQTVSVRTVTGKDLGNMSLLAFVDLIQKVQGD